MRTHGNEHWEFDDNGLMRVRDMSANDYPIEESERRYRQQLSLLCADEIEFKDNMYMPSMFVYLYIFISAINKSYSINENIGLAILILKFP